MAKAMTDRRQGKEDRGACALFPPEDIAARRCKCKADREGSCRALVMTLAPVPPASDRSDGDMTCMRF